MTILDPPRDPIVQQALDLSRELCRGHSIDGAPALRHAVLVARTLVIHVPDVDPEIAAAALLHDAPLFAPDGVSVVSLLASMRPTVPTLVTTMHAEHEAMLAGLPAQPPGPPLLYAMAADKIVAFGSLLRRAQRSGDVAGFFAGREVLRGLFPYFQRWIHLANPELPKPMRSQLGFALVGVMAAAGVHGDFFEDQ